MNRADWHAHPAYEDREHRYIDTGGVSAADASRRLNRAIHAYTAGDPHPLTLAEASTAIACGLAVAVIGWAFIGLVIAMQAQP